jgi:formate dehydrogenase major subunit
MMDRRTFLKRSGLAAGAGAFASQLPYGAIGKAEAAKDDAAAQKEVKRTVCTHCSVGCSVDATVENGVWTRQEPVFDSPLNLGAHCAKGASVREHGMHEHSHRLKSPMKLVDGKYQKISWDQAINEIGDKLNALKKESGPTPCSGSAARSTTTSRRTCCASSCRSSARTTAITRHGSATRRRSPA